MKNKPVVQNISCIIPETAQKGGLFLGNVYGAQNVVILKQYGIRSVLTTSIQTPIQYREEDIPHHLKINAHDKDDYIIMDHIDQCIQFIDQGRKHTNVYVHCFAGVSRSATVICAYLINHYKWSLKQSMEFLKNKRIVAKPNDGFLQQLIKYELTQLGVTQNKVTRKQTILSQQNSAFNNSHKYSINSHNNSIERKDTKKLFTNNNQHIKRYTHHNDIPIPKVLMAGRAPTNTSMVNQHKNTSDFADNKSKVIRPKDLPGYRQY